MHTPGLAVLKWETEKPLITSIKFTFRMQFYPLHPQNCTHIMENVCCIAAPSKCRGFFVSFAANKKSLAKAFWMCDKRHYDAKTHHFDPGWNSDRADLKCFLSQINSSSDVVATFPQHCSRQFRHSSKFLSNINGAAAALVVSQRACVFFSIGFPQTQSTVFHSV